MHDLIIAGYSGIASVIAESATFPIDTAKTRLQIQGQVIDAKHTQLRYRGMLQAITGIPRQEGFRKLYSGIAPSLIRQASYGTIKFGLYYALKKRIYQEQQDESLMINVPCGVIAGVVSSSIANPADVLKIRMQSQTAEFIQKGVVGSFISIAKNEGVKGLWRGLGPNVNRAAVVAGVELPIYDFSKKWFMSNCNLSDSMPVHFLSSSVAGLAGAIASNPIDVVKTRLMNQKKLKLTAGGTIGAPAIYTSSFHCLVQTCRTEGFFALYKGFIPNWMRLGPWNVIFFVTFEELKKL